MSVFKSVCFSLIVCALLNCDISIAQEGMSVDAMNTKALQYNKQKDYKQAMQWWLKAADKGDTKAMHNIGYFYESGLGVQKDKKQAEQWYKKAKEAKEAKNK